eukprot:scaffold309158_cov24-Tisochrysis_lutea.AAC.1
MRKPTRSCRAVGHLPRPTPPLTARWLPPCLALGLLLRPTEARPTYVSLVPNGWVNGQATGHQMNNEDNREFGYEFSEAEYVWTEELCHDDTDGDGKSNGLELGDPCCVWYAGADVSQLRGFSMIDISLPGDDRSTTSRTMP